MKLLIVDTETTGLDVERHRTIEVAAILYSVPHRTTLFQLSTLLLKDKDLAKQAGFQWNPDRKEWTRRMLEADTKDLPFSVVKIPCSP